MSPPGLRKFNYLHLARKLQYGPAKMISRPVPASADPVPGAHKTRQLSSGQPPVPTGTGNPPSSNPPSGMGNPPSGNPPSGMGNPPSGNPPTGTGNPPAGNPPGTTPPEGTPPTGTPPTGTPPGTIPPET